MSDTTTDSADGMTNLEGRGLKLVQRGKVREVYTLPPEPGDEGRGQGRVLMVASDRISAFDVVMPTLVPGKGRLLTQIACWWHRWVREQGLSESHLISDKASDIPRGLVTDEQRAWLEGRVMICRACRVVPIEFVVRGYLEGSGWKDYQQTGSVCGIAWPKGLKQCEQLPEPIFTPATKAASGHDENITFEDACEEVGLEVMGALRDVSLNIYKKAAAHARERGIIIADTKFEFGIPLDMEIQAGRVWNQPILIDEALTPDSSRFWPVEGYEPGRAQPSFDKQFVREYLQGLVDEGKWDKTPPGPELPGEVVEGTLERYERARDLLCE